MSTQYATLEILWNHCCLIFQLISTYWVLNLYFYVFSFLLRWHYQHFDLLVLECNYFIQLLQCNVHWTGICAVWMEASKYPCYSPDFILWCARLIGASTFPLLTAGYNYGVVWAWWLAIWQHGILNAFFCTHFLSSLYFSYGWMWGCNFPLLLWWWSPAVVSLIQHYK